jgi:DNA-binding XRE family transcriptional regulator
MTYAYHENYLNSATAILADMIDYAVRDCNVSGDDFMHMFLISGAAKRFERGNLNYVVGRSGIEVAQEIIQKTRSDVVLKEASFRSDKTPEYWVGWVLAQYQWYKAKSFKNILRYISYSEMIGLYPTLHEADITKLYDVMDGFIAKKNLQTNLKRIRIFMGITQKKLAIESEVSLRSIQMYEQRNKDINKAQAITLAKISRVLGCEIEDLLE